MEWTVWCNEALEQLGAPEGWDALAAAVKTAAGGDELDRETFGEFMKSIEDCGYEYPIDATQLVTIVVNVAFRLNWPDPYLNNTTWEGRRATSDAGVPYRWDGMSWTSQQIDEPTDEDSAWWTLLDSFRSSWDGTPESWDRDVLEPLQQLSREHGAEKYYDAFATQFAKLDTSYAVEYLKWASPLVFSGGNESKTATLEPDKEYENLVQVALSVGMTAEGARELVLSLVEEELSSRKKTA
jgi:hypothetical protein